MNVVVSFHPMCVPLRLFGLPLLFALHLAAQQSRDLYTPPPVLARLERLQQHEDVCALIERTGNYRLERRYAARLDIFDGSLSVPELEEFNRILNDDALRNISRNDVPRPMIMDTIDSFLIDVYRSDGEQHLNFNSPDARKRFRSGTDPLLKWLSNLPKLQHTEASDVKPTHCMPSPLRQDVKPGSQANAINSGTYLLALLSDHFREEKVERNCVIIYGNGRYRREESKQEYMGKIQLRAFDGLLNQEQTTQLRVLLDAPDLKNLKHGTEPKAYASEVDATLLTVPRGLIVQQIKFAHAFQVVGNRDKPGGYSGTQYVVDPDERALDPLLHWLKNNIDNRSGTSSNDVLPTNCEPSR